MKVLGQGSCGTVWLVADEADRAVASSTSERGSSGNGSSSDDAQEQQLRAEALHRLWQPTPRSKKSVATSDVSDEEGGGSGAGAGGRSSSSNHPLARSATDSPSSSASSASESDGMSGGCSAAALVTDRHRLPLSDGVLHHDDHNVVGTFGRRALPPPLRRALKVSPARSPHSAMEVRSEQDVIATLHHPFIVRFHGSTTDEHKTYLCVEAALGGDLHTRLRLDGTVFGEAQARFVAACLTSALGYLHGKRILYRDVKPENVVIDGEGFVQLIDFGLTRRLASPDERAYTLCGTPEYVAPEVIQMQGHAHEADWWSLGILTYELLHGYTPFAARAAASAPGGPPMTTPAEAGGEEDPMAVYRRITHPDVKVDYSRLVEAGVSPPTLSFIKRLLRRKPSTRLGAHDDDAELRAHDFLREVAWRELEARMPSACDGISPLRRQDKAHGVVPLSLPGVPTAGGAAAAAVHGIDGVEGESHHGTGPEAGTEVTSPGAHVDADCEGSRSRSRRSSREKLDVARFASNATSAGKEVPLTMTISSSSSRDRAASDEDAEDEWEVICMW